MLEWFAFASAHDLEASMSLGQNTFRSGAFALTAVATLAAFSFFPATAETFTGKSVATGVNKAVCARYTRDPASHAQCMSNAMKQKIKAIKAETALEEKRGAAADKRRAEAEKRGVEADGRKAEAERRGVIADQKLITAQDYKKCTNFLLDGIKAKSFTATSVISAANGKLDSTNACHVARGFGYARKVGNR